MHELLEHDYLIAAKFDLPICFYSEECQEAQHKEFRSARQHHTCKVSRVNAMENLFKYMLIRTDPVMSSTNFSKQRTEQRQMFEGDEELRRLLVLET